ncbi:MAG: hypothetical protein A2493_02410 [Candidatus Magasanikbacteria bacterium RIFOXYC12_FULL_33_11]|uniref:Type 4 fimbrial biogenesis protein PilX N-terminal domain-containing protein n=1 Tax=Candidatus Magasanikbacteria bacterium RIFOXYC12_FULL_33_11 TaxID=1798701 RepID=A0A1F6NPF1_9BACT|nr:MAG: hypothetical protein A2493_02410 [Candidatus Magasanikbacteria bacterium RIFOXYC12_FULL_33_11]
MNDFFKNLKENKRGSAFLFVMIFGFIGFMTITIGMTSYAIFESKASKQTYRKDLAFHVAEAGIDYYRWHLMSSPEDYYDGQGSSAIGPYVHDYYDKDGNIVGTFSIEIDVPPQGTYVVAVRSTGWSLENPNSKRTIEAYFGYESFSDSSFVVNADMRFSSTSFVHGKTFANGCIEFNGTSDSWVDSAKGENQCSYGNDGVYGTGGPTEFWRYGLPVRSFAGIGDNFDMLKDMANSPEGINLGSSRRWHIVFLDNGTFDLYRVNNYSSTKYDITSETFQSNQSLPENGVIYSTRSIWVEGVVKGRVSVVADNGAAILIPGNLIYSEKHADDILGLLSDTNIIIPYDVPNDMEIDGALLAKSGNISRPYFSYSSGSKYIRDSLSVFGSQIEYSSGGLKWVNSYGTIISGFVDTIYTYDGNLLYKPPIGIPVIPEYKLISWHELN